MKILLATPLYPPQAGGPATDAALLNAELPKRGFKTEVVSFGKVLHLPPGIRHMVYFLQILNRWRGVGAIVSLDTFSACFPAALAAKLLRVPLVVRVPGDYAWEQAVQRFGIRDSIEAFQTKRYGWRIEMMRRLQQRAVRSAALVVVPSDFFKRVVLQWHINPMRVVRIYLGINVEAASVAPRRVPEGKILFSLGRFVPWKGFEMLIALMPRLPQVWHLVIAGGGPLRQKLEAQVRQLDLSRRVTFAGALPRAEALGWYARADAFALNSSFESFSFQVLEAMNSGVSVITTRAGSIPELITGVEGVLCAPNDTEAFRAAIESVESEPEAWHRRTQAAQARARGFSAEKSVDLFAEELKKVCA